MKVTLINPNIVGQKNDFYGTGIPYMPITLAYLAAHLRQEEHDVEVIDAFGEEPWNKRKQGEFIVQGMMLKDIVKRIDKDSDLVFIYASQVVQHNRIMDIVKEVRKKYPKMKIAVLENSQAVYAYSLQKSKDLFLKKGVDYLIFGEPEITASVLLESVKEGKRPSQVPGVAFVDGKSMVVNPPREHIKDLDSLPFPAWDLFPIENYWKLSYSHAPLKRNARYLPMMTSRGCPYQCEFCIIPYMNERKWRPRSAKNVVDEIEAIVHAFEITEIHIEDLNPTLDKKRIQDISKEIIKRKIDVEIKFAAGIKLETIDENTLELLKKAGCTYVSFSPESGSKRVLGLMKKPFDHRHGLKMTRVMNRLGIASQACFVIGFIGETAKDRQITERYVKALAKAGVDEIALFMMTPIPGSKPFEWSQMKPEEISKFTFSPKWREEYKELNRFRTRLYLKYMWWKMIHHPLKTVKQPFNILRRNFLTKMEMTLYRMFKTHFKRDTSFINKSQKTKF